MSALFQHILILEKVSALLQQYVRLITGVRCPPYSNIMSALFQHILLPEKVSALLQQYSVRLIPPVVRLIPTDFDIENSVRLNTAVSKKVSALLQQSAKKCPPYSNILLVRLITVRLSTVPQNIHLNLPESQLTPPSKILGGDFDHLKNFASS